MPNISLTLVERFGYRGTQTGIFVTRETMADRKPKGRAGGATTPPASRDVYGGKKLDPEPPADHANFVEARAAGLTVIRSKLAERRKKH